MQCHKTGLELPLEKQLEICRVGAQRFRGHRGGAVKTVAAEEGGNKAAESKQRDARVGVYVGQIAGVVTSVI